MRSLQWPLIRPLANVVNGNVGHELALQGAPLFS
jgi:hypothetical protein